MKKIIKYVLYFILIFMLLFILTGCSNQDDTNILKSKVKEEILYLDTNLVSILNLINNISYDNYKVSTKNIDSGQDNSNQEQQSSGQEGQSSQSVSQEGGESQSNEQNSGSSSQTQSTMTMEKNGILTSRNLDINWNYLKEIIEELYSSWSTIALDMNALDINSESILSFTNALNDVTKSVKDENKKDTMNNLLSLYALLPKYCTGISDELFTNILNTKLEILNAYILVEDSNWDEINKRLDNAVKEYGNIINNVEINTRNQSGVSQTYILLKELQRSVDSKDADVFYINYKNLMQEIQGLE